MSMVHMSSLFIVSAFALIVGLLIIAQAAAENLRCRSEYTWSSGGNEYGYEALNEDLCGSSSTCGGKYPKPDGLEDRPPPVEDDTVELDFFGIILDPTKNSTCLGITYTLNRYGASKVKGIQFLLDGLGYNSHNKPCCQVLNYTVELNYEAVVADPNSGELRKFSFDCFCDLWPQEPYTLTIRTLPVDFENQTLLDPSSIVRDFKVPGCSPTLEWDQYCQKSKEELWKPQLLVPEQLFPQYLELKVTFNIAPPDYRFIKYVISVLEIDVPKPMQSQTVHTSSLISTPVMVNGLMMNVSSVIFTLEEGDIGKTVHTSMFPKCQSGSADCNTPTHVDKTHLVEIIANPCDLDPCGELGSCEPHEHLYACLCNEGAILDRHPTLDGDTCIDNPCNSDPCGPLGTCGPEGAQYYCNCSSTALYDGETCIPDPCNVPNTCDKYSTCRLDDDFNSECFCADGITCIVDECKKESSPCITMATCGESSLDIIEGWKHHDCNCGDEVFNSTNVRNICPDGRTCNASRCDEHVHCNYIHMPGGVRYNCSCVSGYSFNEEGQCEKDRTVYLVVIVVVAVFLLVTALLVGFRFILKTRPDKICQRNPYSEDISPSPPTPPPEPNNYLHNEPSDVRRVYEPIPSILNRPVNGGGAIDYTIESNNATNNEPNNEPEKRILIISTEETEEHRDVIYKFAVFLKEYAGLIPIIPSQHTNDIHKLTLETWLCNENRQAFKVLFICSLGMLDRWVREREGDPNPDRGIPVESAFGDLFIQMKHITSTERRTLGTLQKFAVAYFSDYFSKRMVDDIELFRGMPCYNLMADVETLCFRLNGIEQNTPTSSRRMPKVKEYERVEEGQALLRAIRVMKSKHGTAAPTPATLRQFSQVSTDSDRTSVSGHYELNSQEGSENSVAFQQITEGAQKEMASVSGFFSNSYSDSDDESSSNSGTHQVDVHRHSGDDSGFTLAQPDYRPVVAVPSKPDDYSLNDLDSGLSSLPISPLSSREDNVPMTGHLASLNASGHVQPMPMEAPHMDACVVHVPAKPDEYSLDVLDSGLNSQPASCMSDAQESSLA